MTTYEELPIELKEYTNIENEEVGGKNCRTEKNYLR
jgi:hypothetical protein